MFNIETLWLRTTVSDKKFQTSMIRLASMFYCIDTAVGFI